MHQRECAQVPITNKPDFVSIIGQNEISITGLRRVVDSKRSINLAGAKTVNERQRWRASVKLLSAQIKSGL